MGIARGRTRLALKQWVPLLLAGFVSAPLAAQSLDPQLLRSLQSQLGVDDGLLAQMSNGASDSATATSLQEVQESLSLPARGTDVPEEQEVRRATARQKLAEIYVPSAVERDYRQRLQQPQLRQFGYDFFIGAPPPTGSRAGAIGGDYVLGVGDEVQVSLRGATNRTMRIRVDRDGQIAIPGLAPIQAAGRSVASVRSALSAATERNLLATDAYLSVGEVRAVSVFVGGEVERPGQFMLTSMSGISTAIARAGGIRRSGSLRQVRVVRANGSTVLVDLYGLLGIGAPSDIHLADGDRVIVPVVGPTVAVVGSVTRPGIYELRGSEKLETVVDFAGGAIRQRGARIAIGRIGNDGSESFLGTPAASAGIIGGDVIEVVGGSAGGTIGRVRLEGNVDNPGARPLEMTRTVVDLVGASEDLRDNTYQLAAVLLRRDPMSGARVYEVLNLANELRQGASTQLQSEDRLFLFSREDIDFLNSSAVRQVVLGQSNPLPQCGALQRLSALVQDTTASRFNAVTRGGFVVVSEKGAELGSVGTAIGQGSQRVTDLASSGQLGVSPGAQGMQPSRQQQSENEQAIKRDDAPARCSAVFEREPELLPVLLEHAISVGGAVRRPGAYPVGGTVSARDLSLVAGGLLAGAREIELDLNRGTGVGAERVPADRMAEVELGSGDDIRFNAQLPEFEGSGVLLAGEVARPGLYTIRKGEKLSELLARAGGLTDYSYAYGTVFTRRSVKEGQEAGFRRTARELNNSLVAIAARSNQGQNLVGAASLVKALSEAEASGRMVVEADPRVLALRPGLDTILEPGDSIYIPKRPNYVLALGDVSNPGALQFVAGKSAGNYLREAGGAMFTADSKRAFMVLPDGTAQPLRAVSGQVPPPGTTIIVPKNVDPLYKLAVIRDVSTIIAQLASSVATIAVLATR